jgi:hypothetical protein
MASVASLTVSIDATADAASTWNRHPRVPTAAAKPAGVPDDYVFTHNGFFHPSCVFTLRNDEIAGADFVIRGFDGAVHDTIPPCPYPHYNGRGEPLFGRTRSSPTPERAHDTYDGWLVFYAYSGSVGVGSSLNTNWTVPSLPTNVGSQDIAFFNDFETSQIILQPVLDFSELPGQWAIESENCCENNNDLQSTLVPVSPGDDVLGTVTATDCDSGTGVCQTWTVTTKDLTTGQSTVLNTSAFGQVANEINPAVLETYSITSCDMLPANGEVTFFDNSVTTASGGAEPEAYQFSNCVAGGCTGGSAVPASCGWGGSSTGNSYTLTFGTSPTPPPVNQTDAGASPVDSGTPDSGGGAPTDAGSPGLTTPDSGALLPSPDAGSGENVQGPSPDSDSGNGNNDTTGFDTLSSNSGCGCAVALGAAEGSWLPGLLGTLATLFGVRRRRSSRR